MEQNNTSENRTPMEKVLYEVKKIIVGQDHLLERMIVALLARGHILVEGVPGLAKTMAIKTLAEAIGGDFKRIEDYRLMRVIFEHVEDLLFYPSILAYEKISGTVNVRLVLDAVGACNWEKTS